MKTKEPLWMPPKLQAELEAVLDDLAKGKRDVEAMKKAGRDMDRMREETRQELGILNMAVELVHEGREES